MNRAGHNSKVKAGPVNAERLKSFVERIERLEEERRAIGGDIRDVYAEAKGVGYDVKTMKKVVRLRSMDAADRAEEETLLDVYLHALGMTMGNAVREVMAGAGVRATAEKYDVSRSALSRSVPKSDDALDLGTDELEAGAPNPDRDGEASADERDASASSSPPESCGSTEGRAGQLLAPDCQLAGSEQSQASQTHKDRKTAGTPEMAASGTAGVESGPQDTDPLTIPPFLRRSATVQP